MLGNSVSWSKLQLLQKDKISGNDLGYKKLNTISRRMFIMSAAKAVVLTAIIGRLFSLQISENKKYLTLSD